MSRSNRRKGAVAAAPAAAPAAIAAHTNGAAPPAMAAAPMSWFSSSGSRPPRPSGVPIGAPPPAPSAVVAAAPPTAAEIASAPPAPAVEVPPPAPPPPPLPVAAPAFRAPPEGQNNPSHAANAYAEQRRTHDGQRWLRTKDVPQGENRLVAAYAHAVTMYPPYGLTLNLHADDGAYELMIAGEEIVASNFPDRDLYAHLRGIRRRPTQNEKFTGRIRALLPNGEYIDVGSGRVALPPEPDAPAQTWGNAGGPAWNAAGAPPWAAAWGAAPPWAQQWGAMPPWAMGSWGGGQGGGMVQMLMTEIAQLRKQLESKPPAEIAGNPALTEMWRAWQQAQQVLVQQQNGSNASQTELTGKLIDHMFAAMSAKASAPAPTAADAFTTIERVAGLMDKFRGPQQSDKPGITIHQVGEATIMEDANGKMDLGGSLLLSALGDAKKIVGAVAQKRGLNMAGASGNRPPGASTPNGGAKTG
jgi:hypothetical protein